MALGDYPQQAVPSPSPQPAPYAPYPTGVPSAIPNYSALAGAGLSGTTGNAPLTPQQSYLDQLFGNIGTNLTLGQQFAGVESAQQRAALQNPYDVSGFSLANQLLGLQQGQTANDYQTQLAQLGLSQTGEGQSYQSQVAQNELAKQIQAQSNLQQTQQEQSSETARGSTVSSGADTARSNIAAQNTQALQQLGLQRTAEDQAHQLALQQFGLQGRSLTQTEQNKMAQYGVQAAQNDLSKNLTQALFGFDQADMGNQMSLLAGALGMNEGAFQQQLLSMGLVNPAQLPGGVSGTPSLSTRGPGTGAQAAAQYQPMVNQAAQQYGVPAQILDAVFSQESGWDPTARNPAGAEGLAQIYLPAHSNVTKAQADDPAFAINWTGQELGAAFKQFNGNVPATILYHFDPSGATYYARTGQFRTAEDSKYVRDVMAKMGQ